MRNYHARQSPRGFWNEKRVHIFQDRLSRDAWVNEHRSDGDVNSSTCGARPCTAKEALRIINYRGNAITESYNAVIEH